MGKGLANSGETVYTSPAWPAAGTLTSPVFTIERNFVRFLVAGRGFDAGTSLQLLIDGKLEFYVCGNNDRKLRPGAFDVSSFQGRKAQLVASDGGTWLYTIVDEIVASDSAGQGVKVIHPMSQCVPVDKQMELAGMRYLTVPINNFAPMGDCVIEVEQRKVQLQMRLAVDTPVDFWASYPLNGMNGKTVRFFSEGPAVFKGKADGFLKQINLATQPREMEGIYAEPGRPQLSFTVKRGSITIPTGCSFMTVFTISSINTIRWTSSSGQYHWGHATSPDLFHWTEQAIAIPRDLGWDPFSGSGVVDHNNDSGLKQGSDAPILLFYSQNRRSATALAYSVDGGKTFREYEKNPLFLTRNPAGHDPKVVWYAPEKKWVMIIHDMKDERLGIRLLRVQELLDWKYLSTSPGWFETPDLFPLPLDGDPSKIKWIVSRGATTNTRSAISMAASSSRRRRN